MHRARAVRMIEEGPTGSRCRMCPVPHAQTSLGVAPAAHIRETGVPRANFVCPCLAPQERTGSRRTVLPGQPILVDTHAHLSDPQLAGDEAGVLSRAAAAGVGAIVNVGTDLATSRLVAQASGLWQGGRPTVFATVGVHPHDAKGADEAAFAELRRLAAEPSVVAIGECGLDYLRDLSPRDMQRRVFARQLALAKELGLPAVIHCRDAYADCLEIVRAELGVGARGVLHCFLGDAA
ncbi:MAG: TatD family deoxyribonuclease, partial [Planctomycetes bacterium]|nr:TatD family deoxyribonuclease [Planctomycetota bacterium]